MQQLPEKWGEVQTAIRQLNARVRHSIPKTSLRFDRLARVQPRPGFLDGRKIERIILFLKSNGCKWARDSDGAGGCSMCGHLAGTSRGQPIAAADLIKQFKSVFDQIDFMRFPMLCLYNSGSFLNRDELPDMARREILKTIAQNDDIQHIIIESRPEFFEPDILREVSDHLENKAVEIGVGFETQDSVIRNAILNKGLENSAYEGLKEKLHDFPNLRLLLYVLVKPPFVPEGFALNDAVASVDYAFNIGADVVSLEPVSVQDFTMVDLLSRAGHYRTPWIWTVIEVVRRSLQSNRLIRMGGFEFYPLPKEFVHNCPRCNTVLTKAINRFNSVNSLDVFSGLDCSCRTGEWLGDIKEQAYPSPESVLSLFESIDVDKIIREMQKEFTIGA